VKSPILSLLRPHQWIKNAFVAAPLFFTPQLVSGLALIHVVLGVACFSAMASAIYILNDWRDRELDRKHPVKRLRPLASGRVAPKTAAAVALCLAVASSAAAWVWLPRGFVMVLSVYVLQNLAYNFWLKQIAILDILCIAIGFVLRIYAGGQLIGITPTVWIVACTLLLALFLAFAKRRDDLVIGVADEHRRSLAGYNLPFIDASLAIVLAALVVSYLLYTTQPDNMARLHSDKLFVTAPFVIAGVLRYLQVTLVEHRSGSPTRLVLSDRFLMLVILGWIATFALLIYG
jgi:decaprenyl-phosphate phosphoribosyltransferase